MTTKTVHYDAKEGNKLSLRPFLTVWSQIQFAICTSAVEIRTVLQASLPSCCTQVTVSLVLTEMGGFCALETHLSGQAGRRVLSHPIQDIPWGRYQQ